MSERIRRYVVGCTSFYDVEAVDSKGVEIIRHQGDFYGIIGFADLSKLDFLVVGLTRHWRLRDSKAPLIRDHDRDYEESAQLLQDHLERNPRNGLAIVAQRVFRKGEKVWTLVKARNGAEHATEIVTPRIIRVEEIKK